MSDNNLLTLSERERLQQRAKELRAKGERMELAARLMWRLQRTRLLIQRAREACAGGDVDEMIDLTIAAFEQVPLQLLPLLKRRIARAASRQ
jgi:hypothetical protein